MDQSIIPLMRENCFNIQIARSLRYQNVKMKSELIKPVTNKTLNDNGRSS